MLLNREKVKKIAKDVPDIFVPEAIVAEEATWFGAALSAMIPVLLAIYLYFRIGVWVRAPPLITTETQVADGVIFTTRFTCVAPKGCYLSLGYSTNSPECRTAIYGNPEWSQFLDTCTLLEQDKTSDLPFCYTADPQDGIGFYWERQQFCGALGGECRFGVKLRTNTLKITRDEEKWIEQDIPLFSGIHVISIDNITESITAESKTATGKSINRLQTLPVHSSGESVISSGSLCCARLKNVTCSSNGSPGTANDYYNALGVAVAGKYYSARIRTFPLIQTVDVEREDIVDDSFEEGGSAYQVLSTSALCMAFVYRVARKRYRTQIVPQ